MVKVNGKEAVVVFGGNSVEVALMRDTEINLTLGLRFMEASSEEASVDKVYLSFANVESIDMLMKMLKKFRKHRIKEGK